MVSEMDDSPLRVEDRLLARASGYEISGRQHRFGKADNA